MLFQVYLRLKLLHGASLSWGFFFLVVLFKTCENQVSTVTSEGPRVAGFPVGEMDGLVVHDN